MKEIITCASYGGTGSSAITDLLLEFDEIKAIKEFEFTIAHEIDGINSLEYGLVNNWNRLNNDEYIYRFYKLKNRLKNEYSKYFPNFDRYIEEYIANLVDISFNGYWHQHKYRTTTMVRKLKYEIPNKVKRKLSTITKNEYEYVPYYKRNKMYTSRPTREKFINETQKFFENIINDLDSRNEYNYIALDQLVPCNNFNIYSRYFNNIKIIVVDRDPRDLYILNKKFWKEGWIPTDNIHDFINWYKILRIGREEELKRENVLFIQFEDLIFSYEKKVADILEFIGISEYNHNKKFQYFNPKVSIKNIQLYKKYNEYEEDIKIIENNLQCYCYCNLN